MPTSSADTRGPPATDTTHGQGPAASERAGFGAALALSVLLAFGISLAALGVILLINRPEPIPGLGFDQNQEAETMIYLAVFGVILPASLIAGPRLADRIARGASGAGLEALCAFLAVGITGLVLFLKLSERLPWGGGVGTEFVVAVVWLLVAAAAIARALRPPPWQAMIRLSSSAGLLWAVSGVGTLLALLCLTDLASISVPVALVGAALALAVLGFERVRPPVLSRRWRIALDALIVAAVLLVVPDVVIVSPEDAPGNLAVALQTSIIQFHQNFLLGPANDVLAGRPMLVDTASQYGVGSIYLLAGWFKLAPIGYGTLGFLSGALSALTFAGGYCVMRMGHVSRMLSAGAMAVAVIALVFNASYPVDAIPQDSALRFGVPMAALVTLAAAERWPRRAGVFWGLTLAVCALASIWSLEGLAFTIAVVAAVNAIQAVMRPPGRRLRWLARRAMWLAAAFALAHFLLAAITLATAGQLPDWGQYLAYLRAFLFGKLGELTYDFERWSPGLAVAAGYVASAAAIVLLVVRDPSFLRRERTAVVILAGTTAYGIAIYSYFDNRSTNLALIGIALPGILTATLWLSLILRSRDTVTDGARRGALVLSLSIAVLLVAVAASAISRGFPRSAVAYAIPGGKSLTGALDRLWNMPALNGSSPEGVRLLKRYMPGESRSLVLVTPDLGIEILIRSGRANTLPIATPWQDSFVVSERLPGLRNAVDDLRPGQRLLLDEASRKTLAAFRADPSVKPLSKKPTRGGFQLVPVQIAPLQAWALKRIGERFELQTVARGTHGLSVVQLTPRR